MWKRVNLVLILVEIIERTVFWGPAADTLLDIATRNTRNQITKLIYILGQLKPNKKHFR